MYAHTSTQDKGMLHATQRRKRRRATGKGTSASMLPRKRTEPPPESPHTPILPLSHRTKQERKKRTREPGPRKQARRKPETHTRAEAGKKCMPGRRTSQRIVEERVKSDEATKETGGSQQPSKGRAQGGGHGKHTANTTLQQSTGEWGTRGIDEGQHHAPRHAPHRHHTHRTHPDPRPQHVASGPQQPAQRAGSREGGAPEPRRPPPSPRRAAPHRAREPRGQCRAPTPAHPHPQHVGSGPRQPAWRAGSWGRGSA